MRMWLRTLPLTHTYYSLYQCTTAMSNTFGHIFTLTTFGESHGETIGAVLDGMASGIAVDEDFIAQQMKLRQSIGALSTARREADKVRIVSGVFNGRTTGTPMTFIIENQDTRSKDYGELAYKARPGHADFSAQMKYHGFQDFRGGGHLAADLLAELIANPSLPPRHLKFGPVRLVRRQSTRSLKVNDPRITRAVERIRRDAATGITSADILAEIPLSRRLAEKRFREATGHSILDEIQDVRFGKICELLETDIPIGHIANRCGLQSDSFLKRFFKARTGMTLRAWRNAHLRAND